MSAGQAILLIAIINLFVIVITAAIDSYILKGYIINKRTKLYNWWIILTATLLFCGGIANPTL